MEVAVEVGVAVFVAVFAGVEVGGRGVADGVPAPGVAVGVVSYAGVVM